MRRRLLLDVGTAGVPAHRPATAPAVRRGADMPTYLIERNIPGAGGLGQDQLRDIALKSNKVVADLGVPYTWVRSYVAGDKIYCVHETDDVETIREHARCGGFPADLVVEVAAEIGPETADS